MNGTRKVSVRELQHNLSDYLEMAKFEPILVTKYGKEEILMVNSENFKITNIKDKKKKLGNIMASQFIGMHENKKIWKGKTSIELTNKLRRDTWYGR